MSTTWQTVYDRAKRRYGYTTGEEDSLLTDALFLDRVNELLAQMGDQAGGFREEFTLNLPLGTASSLGAIALSSRVIRIVDGSVRLDYDQSGSFTSQLAIKAMTIGGLVSPAPFMAAPSGSMGPLKRKLSAISLRNDSPAATTAAS